MIGLVAITPGLGMAAQQPLEAMAAAGLRAVILREPGLTERAYVGLARALAPIYGSGLILHSKQPAALEIAQAAGWGYHAAAGVDLGAARAAVRGLLGASCHDLGELQAAADARCDYAVLSPVYAPTSKPGDARPPLGLEGFAALARAVPVPILALGGVTPERCPALIAAGAAGIAALGGLFGADGSPEAAAARVILYRAALRASELRVD